MSDSSPLAPYQGPWNEQMAVHLYNRAGFGATLEEIESAVHKKPDEVVQRLVDYKKIAEEWDAPDWVEEIAQEEKEKLGKGLSRQDKKVLKKQKKRVNKDNMRELQYWWIHRMAATSRPLQEKLTLFWHGHFATAFSKVKDAYLMWLQNETMRRNANENAHTMVMEISRDPAMVIWLDNDSNVKKHPNENYARELMELFTLGEGNYTETDIMESARAFTGWGFQKGDRKFKFNPREHDDGPKTFMGQKGKWDGGDIVNIIFRQPQCAKFIAGKLWAYFAYENPEPAVLNGLADLLQKSKYDLKPVLWKIFTCRAFYSDRAVNTQIKSPVQLVIDTFRKLGKDLPVTERNFTVVMNVMKLMGQEIFEPPSVKGWDGGLSWVNTASLLLRYNFANYLVQGVPSENMVVNLKKKGVKGIGKGATPQQLKKAYVEPVNPRNLVEKMDEEKPEELIRDLSRILYNYQEPDPDLLTELGQFMAQNPKGVDEDQKVRDLIHLMMSTPQYQLC